MHGRLGSKGRCVSDAGDDKDLGFFCFRVLSHLNLMTVLFDGCYYKSYCMKSDSESLEKVTYKVAILSSVRREFKSDRSMHYSSFPGT